MALSTVSIEDWQGIVWNKNVVPADCQAISALVKNDFPPFVLQMKNAFRANGRLFVPNRGELQVRPGDVVAVDTTLGGVILIPAQELTGGGVTLE